MNTEVRSDVAGPDAPGRLPISVIIPAFNREKTIGRALSSVWAQEQQPAEVLVVDDASTDSTVAVAREAGARVIELGENGGAATARNAGIAAAAQPWIAFLDSDDEWLPHHLVTLWPHTKAYDFVAGTMITVNDTSGVRMKAGVRQRRRLRDPAVLVFPDNFIPSGGVVVSTDVLRQTGGFDSRLRYSEDLDLWLRVLEKVEGLALPDPVLLYHIHDGQKTSRRVDARSAQWELLARYREARWWSALAFERRVALNRCELDILAGRKRLAARRLVDGLIADPRVYLPVVRVIADQSVRPRLPARVRNAVEAVGA